MSHILVQANLERTTNLPRDRSVNTFHFSTLTTPAPDAEITACLDAVEAFYRTPGAGTGETVWGRLSSILSGTCTLKAYNMADPSPRPPRMTRTFTQALGAFQPLPSEVAACLSYKGDLPAGGNPANYRGRIYVGPLNVNCSDGTPTAGDVHITATTMDTILRAGATHLMAPATPRFCVFSRDLGALVPVTNMHVDNAFDTQRRRGARSTTRQVATR